MFKNKLWQALARLIALVGLTAITLVSQTAAQSVSYGCEILPIILSASPTFSYEFSGFSFFAGETLTVIHIGTATEVFVEFPTASGTIAQGGSFTYTMLVDGFTTFWIYNFTGSGYITPDFTCIPRPQSDNDELDNNEPESHCPVFHDGRINSCDTFNPVVLYGRPDSDDNWRLEVYNSDGSGLLFAVPADVINAVEHCPADNTLIYEDDATGISVWSLAERPDGTCPYQLNAPMDETGKWYIIVFDELYPNTYYESWTEFIDRQVQVPGNEIASVNSTDNEAAAVLCRFLALSDNC